MSGTDAPDMLDDNDYPNVVVNKSTEANNSVIVPIDFIRAVAHIGVDFGYGEYKLEQKWIDLARKIYTEAQKQ